MKTYRVRLMSSKDGGLTKRYLVKINEEGESLLTDEFNKAGAYASYSVARAACDFATQEYGYYWICEVIES